MTLIPNPAASAPRGPDLVAPRAPLRVALDLRLIHNSGIGSYLVGLLEGFGQIRPPVEWTFIGDGAKIPPHVPRTIKSPRMIEFRAPIYGWEEFRRYPALRDIDVLHFPHYNLPLLSLPKTAKTLVTVYDLFHLNYGNIPKRVYQRFFLNRLAWKRVHVAAISTKTREDLLARSRVRPESVSVVHLGAGRVISEAERIRRGPTRPRPIKLSTGRVIEPPWLLSVGINKPHKNMDFLTLAMAMWSLRRDDVPPLIWLGPDKETIPQLMAAIPAHGREKIIIEPYSQDAPVEDLYAGAKALVFPSLDEGFGFPPLEAMSRGVPVVCSRRRPMTDLLGDAPLWFDPEDSATLWRALDRLMDDPAWAREAAERGRRVAAEYTWTQTARQTFELYAKLAGRDDLFPQEIKPKTPDDR